MCIDYTCLESHTMRVTTCTCAKMDVLLCGLLLFILQLTSCWCRALPWPNGHAVSKLFTHKCLFSILSDGIWYSETMITCGCDNASIWLKYFDITVYIAP